MRSKEEAHDYRYFPEPDLLPLDLEPAWIADVRRTLPELPDARRRRFTAEYELPAYDAAVLTASKELSEYFEAAVRAHRSPKAIANWVMGDVICVANERAVEAEPDFSDLPVAPEHLGRLVALIDDGTISGKIAKSVFARMVEGEGDPRGIVEREGWVQVSDESAIAAVVDRVVAAHGDKVAEYRGGKDKLFGFFVGQVMRESAGRANPATVNKLLRERLDAGR
jgi:aspartyl-tRNA(Asn)/glutamyl-tRNA(Gln) amidotransferase subunit B